MTADVRDSPSSNKVRLENVEDEAVGRIRWWR
jgi:hypothetical protein